MQDSSMYQQIQTQFPDQEHLKCPRCDSTNTKFCYYNNYNLSQPRHFCKNCRRYWTKGGSLRNIPIGGGSRKNTKRSSNPKRPSPSPSSSSAAQPGLSSETSVGFGLSGFDSDRRMLEMGGSFGSLLSTNGQFGNLMDGFGLGSGSHGSNSDSNLGLDGIRNPEVELGRNDDLSCWGSSGNGWPDLAIYTPGSTFQ